MPSDEELEALFAPQLLLEAAMAERGGFEKIEGKAPTVHLSYWQANGLGDGGEVKDDQGRRRAGPGDAGAGREDGRALRQSRPRPMWRCRGPRFVPHFNDYAHLERVAEWSTTGGSDE